MTLIKHLNIFFTCMKGTLGLVQKVLNLFLIGWRTYSKKVKNKLYIYFLEYLPQNRIVLSTLLFLNMYMFEFKSN